MARILLVDDVAAMRKALTDLLSKHGHQVTEAANGRMARDILTTYQFDLILSDIQMPVMDGVALLKWVKEHTTTPMILMTGFSHILETHEAFSLGAEDFLLRPMKYDEVLSSVSAALGGVPAKEEEAEPDEDIDHKFCRIPIEDFISSKHLNAAIYVRLSSSKYVRVSHRGDNIPPERVDNYKQRGLHYLYTRKEDFANIVGFNLYLSKSVVRSKSLELEKKLAFMRYSTETVLEEVRVNGMNSESFEHAKELVSTVWTLSPTVCPFWTFLRRSTSTPIGFMPTAWG